MGIHESFQAIHRISQQCQGELPIMIVLLMKFMSHITNMTSQCPHFSWRIMPS